MQNELPHFAAGQRVVLVKDDGPLFPCGSTGTIVEDVTDKWVGRQPIAPLGHTYRVQFDHRKNMPPAYIPRNFLEAMDA